MNAPALPRVPTSTPAPQGPSLASLAEAYVSAKARAAEAEEAAKLAAKPLLSAMQAAKVLKVEVDEDTSVSFVSSFTSTKLDGLAERLAAYGEDVELPHGFGAVTYTTGNVSASVRVNRKGA